MTHREPLTPKHQLPASCGQPVKAKLRAPHETTAATRLKARLARLIARILKEVA